MNWKSWEPALLSPRLARMRWGRRTIVFGGCGFIMFYYLSMSMVILMVWMLALSWDVTVLMVFVAVACYVYPIRWLYHGTRNVFAWRNEWVA